jgi:uncharacterized protein YneF (UPF0154 family)
MSYWEGKCFFCLFLGTLVLIAGLSVGTAVSEKDQQNTFKDSFVISNQVIETSALP